jgi:hypothetical protein
VIGHLGARVSALLDGQLPPAEEERAWEHVHSCHFCRDAVEREGWVKTRLAGLSFGDTPASERLKGSLIGAQQGLPPGDALLAMSPRPRWGSLVAIGGGAAGAAVRDRRAPSNLPSTSLVSPTSVPRLGLPSVQPSGSRQVR